jgi:hypothetical protein
MNDELLVPEDFAVPDGLMAGEFRLTPLSTSTGDVIGCVYIYPASGHEPGGEGRQHVSVRSWVRADCAPLDPVLHDAVLAWVERDWPFDSIEYAPRT